MYSLKSDTKLRQLKEGFKPPAALAGLFQIEESNDQDSNLRVARKSPAPEGITKMKVKVFKKHPIFHQHRPTFFGFHWGLSIDCP